MQERNMFYKKQEWSNVIRTFKKFAGFGLIEFSEHAKQQLGKRGLKPEEILKMLAQRDSTITQCHEKGTYNNNPDDVIVVHGKIHKSGKLTPLHVIVALDEFENGGKNYRVVTSYVPDKKYFHANGLVLRTN